MCASPNSAPLEFAVRAIAAGAAGRKLAAWAIVERDRLHEERLADEVAQQAMWKRLTRSRRMTREMTEDEADDHWSEHGDMTPQEVIAAEDDEREAADA